MKILIASDWYIPQVNGVVTSLLNLKSGLTALGHEVRVLTLSKSRRPYRRKDVWYAGSYSMETVYPGARLRTYNNQPIINDIIKWKPDIIHSNTEFSSFALAKMVKKALNIPLVHTYHTMYEDYTRYILPGKPAGKILVFSVTRRLATSTDCIIAPGEKLKRTLLSYRLKCPIEIIPTGIELNRFLEPVDPAATARIRQEMHIPKDHLLLVYVGRLAKEKNCFELLKYLGALKDEPISLLMVGNGPLKRDILSYADGFGLFNKVHFAGEIPPSEVTNYYHAGDVFVSSSTSETQGLTYIEALASGLPLLCRKDDCLKNVVLDGENGFMYENKEQFVKAVKAYMNSPKLREELSANASKSALKFSKDTFVERVEALYYKVLQSKGVNKIDLLPENK